MDYFPIITHAACSAAALRYPDTIFDMVRVGILQYGFFPNRETFVTHFAKKKIYKSPIKRVISWKSKIMDIKSVKAGEFIGYGTSYFTNSLTKIAIIPVGYYLGFNRNLSNRGKVLIGGQRVAVIGTINMNALTVDITELKDVKIGDEVVLIGKQGNMEISVSSFSDFSNQLNYEMLTRLPKEIPRYIVD